MDFVEAKEEYLAALHRGQREQKELLAAGKSPHPAVLDQIIDTKAAASTQLLGHVEIPAERIVGTRSAGRITTFSASFLPLAKASSEFALKWTNLCAAHMGPTGIRDPITCYEYLNKQAFVKDENGEVEMISFQIEDAIQEYITNVLNIPESYKRSV